MAVHGVPGATGDLGLRVDPDPANASGLTFAEAWPKRVLHAGGTVSIPFLGHDELIRNKRASGRPKDLVDLDLFERGRS